MKLGAAIPQTEIGTDPSVIRDFAQTAEAVGFSHLLIFDHVLGAHPDRFPERAPSIVGHEMHEPLVLFGFIAGVTQRIEMATGVLVLPQRQTALVAKQAAEVDVLSQGRLRLGVGVGWNFAEFEALNEEFTTRGRRVAEQIEVMRLLWTKKEVTFEGKWHHLDRVGIAPLPVQQPIPVWMGGTAEPALRRAARIADGWFAQLQLDQDSHLPLEVLRRGLTDAGRDSAAFGIEGRMSYNIGGPADWLRCAEQWRVLGATHLTVNTIGARLPSPRHHIEAIVHWKKAIDTGL